jgi:pimeloyl-ACP methyl ester carboxylesterase
MSVLLQDQDIIHYEVLGRGRPILFLHGWVGSWRYWIPAMQAVSMSFRAYSVDLWGFGDSARAPARYSLDQQVSLLDYFMGQMGIGRIALVGHGLGGVLALLYAQRYPEIVDRVMVIACPLDGAMLSTRLRTSSPPELAEWLLGHAPAADAVRADAPKADLLAIQTSLSDLNTASLRELSANLPTACLFVYGQVDPAVTAPRLDDQVNLPYQTHIIILEQSGHFPMLDEANKFNRLLADFTSLASGETPRDLQLKEEWKRRVR